DGPLADLLAPGAVVVSEAYPAEYYRRFALPTGGSKRDLATRRRRSARLMEWAQDRGVLLQVALREQLAGGFDIGPAGEDAFDAAVVMCALLDLAIDKRLPDEPQDERLRRTEGWVLGMRTGR